MERDPDCDYCIKMEKMKRRKEWMERQEKERIYECIRRKKIEEFEMKRKEKLKLLEKEGSIQNQSRNIEESNNKNTSNDGFQG